MAVGPVPGGLLTGNQRLVPLLPEPRGPLTAVLLHELRQPAGRLPPIVLPETAEPIADEDVQLALYVLYELHYRGFDGVDERWEWQPSALALRQAAEERFEDALRAAVPVPMTPTPKEVPHALTALVDADDAPSLSKFLKGRATLAQFREF